MPGRMLHRLVRAGVLVSAVAGIVLLVVSVAATLDVDRVIPALFATGLVAGLLSSIRYLTVRLPVRADPQTVEAAWAMWGQLRGMLGDLGFAALLGLLGWGAACITHAAIAGPVRFQGTDMLAFLFIGGMWMAGWLAAALAAFLIWTPVAIFVGAARERRRGHAVRAGWLVIAWVLTGLDILVALMTASAVVVPGGDRASADDLANREPWQVALVMVTNLLLVLASLAIVGVSILRLVPRKWLRRRRAPRSPDDAEPPTP